MTNFILIDFENVQPKNLNLLNGHPFHVLVFVGASQKSVPIELAKAMQTLKDAADYIQISRNGKNAADFHIACYLGKLTTENPKAAFHIISKDTGFDPLVEHLKSQKIKIQRSPDIAEIPILRMSNTKDINEKVDGIVTNLQGRGASKPKKETTLINTVNSLFTEKLQEKDLQIILKKLVSQNYITLKDGNVTYNLPKKIAANQT